MAKAKDTETFDAPAAKPRNPDTATKIAALEEKIFGKDCKRDADGRPLERGAGSLYAQASAQDKALLDALYALQAAETKVAEAEAAHGAAADTVAAAQMAVEKAETAAKG